MALSGLKSFWNQSFRIPAPPLTEKNLPDQTGKVHVVTGGYAGVGQELARILYSKNATVYVAGRSLDKANISISATKFLFPSSKSRIEFLKLDLADLSTINKSAEEFMAKESRLDVLVNNAGVMFPPAGEKDEQGHELQMGTNVLGH
jgi:retinol dehydrogenase-12